LVLFVVSAFVSLAMGTSVGTITLITPIAVAVAEVSCFAVPVCLGAVIGGALGAWLYARKKKLAYGTLADMAAPGLLLAQGIGRWGNYFNMEAYGPVITDVRLQFFPLAVLIPQGDGYVCRSAILCAVRPLALYLFCLCPGQG